MTEYDKMHDGQLYHCSDEEIMKLQLECLSKLYEFNDTRPNETKKRDALL